MEKIIAHLIKHEVIEIEESDLYLYGFKQLLVIVCHLVAYAAIAYRYHEIWLLLVFLVFFVPLRSYAGGYHTTSQWTCFLVSIATVMGVLMVLKMDGISLQSYKMLAVVSYAIIVMLAPRESGNKPYQEDDKAVYRKTTLLILNTEVIIANFMIGIKAEKFFECMSLALFLVALLLMVDWTVQKIHSLMDLQKTE